MRSSRSETIFAVAWFALWGILVALDTSGSGPFETWPAGISFITFGVLAQVALGYFVGRGWALLCPCVGVAALIGLGLLEPADEPLSGAVVLIFLILPIAVVSVAVGYRCGSCLIRAAGRPDAARREH